MSSFIDSHHCVTLNGDLPPSPKSPSVLDIAIASAALAPLCLFKIDDDHRGSDHYPINIFIFLQIKYIEAFSHKIKIPDKHLKDFTLALMYSVEAINNKIREIPNDKSLEQYDFLTYSIIEIAHNYSSSTQRPDSSNPPSSTIPRSPTPRVRSRKTSPPSPWWNNKCYEAVTRRKLATRNYRKDPTQNNYEKHTTEIRECRKTLRIAKRTEWRTYCESLGPFTPTAKVWKPF